MELFLTFGTISWIQLVINQTRYSILTFSVLVFHLNLLLFNEGNWERARAAKDEIYSQEFRIMQILFFLKEKKKKKLLLVLKNVPESLLLPLQLCKQYCSAAWKHFFVHISECPATPHCLLHVYIHQPASEPPSPRFLVSAYLAFCCSCYGLIWFSALYHERWHIIWKHPYVLSLRCCENVCLYFRTRLLKNKIKSHIDRIKLQTNAFNQTKTICWISVLFWGSFDCNLINKSLLFVLEYLVS